MPTFRYLRFPTPSWGTLWPSGICPVLRFQRRWVRSPLRDCVLPQHYSICSQVMSPSQSQSSEHSNMSPTGLQWPYFVARSVGVTSAPSVVQPTLRRHNIVAMGNVRITGLRTYVQVIRNPYPKHGEPFGPVVLDRSSFPEAAGSSPVTWLCLPREYS